MTRLLLSFSSEGNFFSAHGTERFSSITSELGITKLVSTRRTITARYLRRGTRYGEVLRGCTHVKNLKYLELNSSSENKIIGLIEISLRLQIAPKGRLEQ